jgi:beta-glucosidase
MQPIEYKGSFSFPSGFLWGTADSAYQVEGAWNEDGRGESNWDRWCHTPGKIRSAGTADVAIDRYHRWCEDADLLHQLGVNAHRFSIAWSRVQPNGQGAFNAKGIAFYDRWIDALLARDIQPFICLCHYDIPQALEDQGGWVNRTTTDRFATYAEEMVRHFGDRVKYWLTFNEPICIADGHYAQTIEPPGLGDPQAGVQVGHHLLLAHGKAMRAMKPLNRRLQVSQAWNLYPIHPFTAQLLYKPKTATAYTKDTVPVSENMARAVQLADGYMNRWWLDPLYLGRYPRDIWEHRAHRPTILPGDMELIHQRPDFLGLNYYCRFVVRPVVEKDTVHFALVSPQEFGAASTSMGWEIYPRGLYELLTRLYKDYDHPALYVTENGMSHIDTVTSDGHIHDSYRIDFLQQHVTQMYQTVKEGVPVHGYFAWTAIDNFEWEEGWHHRFGLIHLDYQTLTRIIKDSGRWYHDIISH